MSGHSGRRDRIDDLALRDIITLDELEQFRPPPVAAIPVPPQRARSRWRTVGAAVATTVITLAGLALVHRNPPGTIVESVNAPNTPSSVAPSATCPVAPQLTIPVAAVHTPIVEIDIPCLPPAGERFILVSEALWWEPNRGNFSEYYMKTELALPVGHHQYPQALGSSALGSMRKFYIVSLTEEQIDNLPVTYHGFVERLPDGVVPVSNVLDFKRTVW